MKIRPLSDSFHLITSGHVASRPNRTINVIKPSAYKISMKSTTIYLSGVYVLEYIARNSTQVISSEHCSCCFKGTLLLTLWSRNSESTVIKRAFCDSSIIYNKVNIHKKLKSKSLACCDFVLASHILQMLHRLASYK